MFAKKDEKQQEEKQDESKKKDLPLERQGLHPNALKTLKDQEIKRDALAASYVAPQFKTDGPVTTAGYAQNATNGSIQPDGIPASQKLDSDDPDFDTRKKQQEEWQEEAAKKAEEEKKAADEAAQKQEEKAEKEAKKSDKQDEKK